MGIIRRVLKIRARELGFTVWLLGAGLLGVAEQDRIDTATSADLRALLPKVAAPAGAAVKPAAAVLARLDPIELQCAAATIWWEARGESTDGQRAVFEVIINRARDLHHRWSTTLCGVVTDPHQFEGVSLHGLQVPRGDLADFQVLKDRVADWMAFGFDAPVTDANYYHADWMAIYPEWSRSMRQVLHLGHHVFYRA